MNRSAPQPQMAVTIAMETYTNLCAASADTGYQKEVWEIASEAVHEWLARNAPDSFGMPTTSGVQWKELFLPTGTVLRTIFQGKNYHCIVEGDTLQYQGKAISPSRFANGVGGAGRNAWKVIWILFPKTTTWKLAQKLRQARPRRVVKKAIMTGERHQGGRQSGTAAARAGGSVPSAARQAAAQAQGKQSERRHQRRSRIGHLRRGAAEVVARMPAGVAPDAQARHDVKPGTHPQLAADELVEDTAGADTGPAGRVVDTLERGEPCAGEAGLGGTAHVHLAGAEIIGGETGGAPSV